MLRIFLLAVLCLAAAVQAQPFPPLGTGVYTWEHVGDRPLAVASMSFGADGRLHGLGALDTVYVYEPAAAGPPAGHWFARGKLNGLDTVYPLGGDTLVVARGNGTTLARSVDGGRTWTIILVAPPLESVGPEDPAGFAVVPPGTPHAGRILAGGRFHHSDDRGASWQPADISALPVDQAGVRDGFLGLFAPLPSGRILAGGDWGIAYTDDGGDSYAATPIWGVYRYQTFGAVAVATPGSRQTGTPDCGLADTSLCDGAVAIGIGEGGVSGPKAWWTNDGGRSWSAPVALPQPGDGLRYEYSAGVVSLGQGADGLGRAVTVMGRGVVYVTDDGGQSWRLVGRMPLGEEGDLIGHWANQMALGPDGHLWVSTRYGNPVRGWMYRSAEPADAAFAVAGEAPPEASERLGLSVRPNPAGGRVQVVLSAAEAGTARVVVVDALGREVAVVLDGAVAAGERSLSVETGSWPPGVYVVRASVGDQTASARLVVAR